MSFINPTCKSYYSLGYSPSSIDSIVEKSKEAGCPSVVLTDTNLFGCVKLELACKKAGLKAIQGYTARLPFNNTFSFLPLLAKNHQGFLDLVKINNEAQTRIGAHGVPNVDLGAIESVTGRSGNVVALIGGVGSELANVLFSSLNAYKARTYEEVKSFIVPNWKEELSRAIQRYRKIFDGNVFYEIQPQEFPVNELLNKTMRWASEQFGFRTIYSPNVHYINKIDAQDQRVLLCIHLKTTLKKVSERYDEFGVENFFRSNSFYFRIPEESEETKNTLFLNELCESYSILSKPNLPSLYENSIEKIKDICREGWKTKILPHVKKEKHTEYQGRIVEEFKVIEEARLSDYFLIIRDICEFAQKNNILMGPGRGSAAGCLVSYLLDITKVDPIRFGLYFERFYNAGRNDPKSGKFSLPDIDLDFPPSSREKILDYIRGKYGRENVGQICTFGKLMGKAALQDVIKVHDALSLDEIFKITEHIPDKAKIADDLQVMEEEEEEDPTIIRWALLNKPDKFKDYAYYEDNELKGPLASLFSQAMRLQGCPKATSKHASGVVVSSKSMQDTIPLLHDKSNEELLVGLELTDTEKIGLVKLDILGLSVLDKIQSCVELIEKERLIKIISGGQTGADIAGLMVAKKLGLMTGGWIPKGWKTLDGPKPEYQKLYNMKEHESDKYPPRTEANIIDADATIRFASDFNSAGEKYTLNALSKRGKPHIDIDINDPKPFEYVRDWLKRTKIKVLNVAGNSEKTSPGIQKKVYDYLYGVLCEN